MKLLTAIILVFPLIGSTYFQFEQPLKSDIKGIEKQFGSKHFKLKSKVFLADDFFPNAGTFDIDQPFNHWCTYERMTDSMSNQR